MFFFAKMWIHFIWNGLEIQVNLDLKMQPSKFLPKRVPCRLRNVRTDAYTPQMLLIGPLSKKPQIMELSKNDSRYTTQTQLAYMCITFSFSTLFFLVYVKIVRRTKNGFCVQVWSLDYNYNIQYMLYTVNINCCLLNTFFKKKLLIYSFIEL